MRARMATTVISGFVLVLLAPVALAATNFTSIFTPGSVPPEWTFTGGTDGSSNRLGGASNPQTGADSANGNVPVVSISAQKIAAGTFSDYAYRQAPDSGLS